MTENHRPAARHLPRRDALRLAAAGLTAGLATPGLARAQRGAWPTGPVRFIGIFPPGGGTDILSRIWCHRIGEISGQQFIVENRSGSAGNVGTEAIARAPADGNTIGLASVAPLGISPTLYSSLPFNVNRDFTYVSGLWQLPNLLIVNNDVPARTVPELIALLKENPGKYAYASSGSGTTVHLSGEMFKSLAGLDILHVPYRGGAPAHIDLLAGRVHMIFDNIPQGLASAREGKVRALAVTGAERSPQAPEIPTMAEFLPGFEITSWGGVMGPAGLPQPMVERLSALTKQALESPDLVTKFRDNGATTWWTTPEELAEFRRQNEAAFAPLIRASGARVD
ncbi:tripartite tricarboxylate transporter substrate binding protein [Siccirubricoccus sp. G192]|uniref:Bug family tripartite tricarboxylate transporter substrate binding protein n=1 Tax=Siccirubricoccus sp. G192 TaxID=2849651 RepID=UPI001C2C92E8|nr:tripartite tricarboxylate transporter substrate binding protein [Siccirubricoccus sp. G192]MBV1795794.1 tripartite tricarboxylate transporter substrate binding protein [Siccirubricoccus sp. G192]